MKNKEAIGVAFLGVGRMGETHLRNLTAISGVKVVAVADLILERAERGRQMTGAELAVTDSAKAIEHPAVDAVVIVTSTGSHAELIKQAAVAGKAVITPAPLAPVVAGTDAEFDAAAVGAEIHLRGRRGSRHQRADRRCCEKKLSHADLLSHDYPSLGATRQRRLCFANFETR